MDASQHTNRPDGLFCFVHFSISMTVTQRPPAPPHPGRTQPGHPPASVPGGARPARRGRLRRPSPQRRSPSGRRCRGRRPTTTPARRTCWWPRSSMPGWRWGIWLRGPPGPDRRHAPRSRASCRRCGNRSRAAGTTWPRWKSCSRPATTGVLRLRLRQLLKGLGRGARPVVGGLLPQVEPREMTTFLQLSYSVLRGVALFDGLAGDEGLQQRISSCGSAWPPSTRRPARRRRTRGQAPDRRASPGPPGAAREPLTPAQLPGRISPSTAVRRARPPADPLAARRAAPPGGHMPQRQPGQHRHAQLATQPVHRRAQRSPCRWAPAGSW